VTTGDTYRSGHDRHGFAGVTTGMGFTASHGTAPRLPTRGRARWRPGSGTVDGPEEGLTVAARTHDRVLYVSEVDGVAKQAVIVRDGPAAAARVVESWARCDWSDLPDAVATRYERDGKQLWLSADRDTAYVGSDPADVEAWPRESEPIGCQ
jgi:hypothetical protein